MNSRAFNIWYRLSSSLWFIPSLMVALAIGLWYGMAQLDIFLEERGFTFGWMLASSVEGNRSILSTIAGSIITVTGVVFSITILVLSQSAVQFGPQLVKSFMQDKNTQVALGIFSATFIYSLLTLGSVRSDGDASQSQAATALALLLSLASIIVLIRFIHSMARSVQSNRVIANVVKEMNSSVNRVFPANSGKVSAGRNEPDNIHALPDTFNRTARPVLTSRSGFIQAIDLRKLLRLAAERDLILKVRFTPGGFVSRNGVLADAWPAEHINEKCRKSVQDAFVIGDDRTTEQDVEFSLERLSMIAVRAISPSINDPYTAVICIQWLGVMLCHLAGLDFLNPYHFDKEKRLRVITAPVKYTVFLDAAFDEIRHSATTPMIFICLLENICVISKFITRPEDHHALIQHANYIENDSRRKLSGVDLQKVKEKYRETLKTLIANRIRAK